MRAKVGAMLEILEEKAMMTLKEFMNEQMQNPEFSKAYQEIQPELSILRAINEARSSQNLTQKELAMRTGIAQTEISKIEKGTRNPSNYFSD